jgi:hypothetical protein
MKLSENMIMVSNSGLDVTPAIVRGWVMDAERLEKELESLKSCETCKHSENDKCENPDGYCAPEQWDRWESKYGNTSNQKRF